MADTKSKRGRPSTYTPEIAAIICERLANGESLRSICKGDNMPPFSTVRQWVLDDAEGFATQYTRARDMGLDAVADEVLAIADEKSDPQDKRVRFDARRWYLSKLAPKRYGDRLELAGDKDAPIQTRVVIEVVDSAQKGSE